ncbi:phage polarity suppression protein [Providencia hangzhouensis]
MTAIGFRPDRISWADNQLKYSTEQSLIFSHRRAELSCKKFMENPSKFPLIF